MKVLLSAYACVPGLGSEPGVGWNWAIGLARAGHEVWVLTRSVGRDSVQAACSAEPHPNLHVAYYDLPGWILSWAECAQQVRYQLWQWGVFRTASELHKQVKFDVIHHITFGVWRHHSLLPMLDAPFVFGPVGGGESAPYRLRKSFPLDGKIRDLLRDFVNIVALFDPILRMGFRRAVLILCKTAETARFIPEKYRQKCLIHSDIGAPRVMAPTPRAQKSTFRILFAGNIVYLKGIHLALSALASVVSRVPNTQFTVVGSGPEQPRLQMLAKELGIEQHIEWRGRIPQDELLDAYAEADVFLFPSLHDSSGNVVLESLSRGLPVVCLNLGGPAQYVDATCGMVVDTHGLTEEQTSSALAEALCSLAGDEVLRTKLSDGALRKAEVFGWDSVIGRLYETISQILQQRRVNNSCVSDECLGKV